MGSGCGSVGRAVTSNTRDPRFESRLRQTLFTFNCIEKTTIKKKVSCHSSVVLSAPTILLPKFKSPAHHLMLFSICIVEIETVMVEREKDENKRNRGHDDWPIFKKGRKRGRERPILFKENFFNISLSKPWNHWEAKSSFLTIKDFSSSWHPVPSLRCPPWIWSPFCHVHIRPC